MTPLKILVVEDEGIIAINIENILKKQGYVIADVVASGELAIRSVKNNIPDVVLMDIQLRGTMDGISAARSIVREYALPIIFMTQHEDDEMFRNAKEVFPENYISKPFTERTLIRAIELAMQNALGRRTQNKNSNRIDMADHIFVPTSKGNKIKVLLSNIAYISANGSYSRLHFSFTDKTNSSLFQEPHLDVSLSSNQLITQLNYDRIIRVHKSFHINIDKIDKVNTNTIFIGEAEIPIGDEYSKDFFDNRIRSINYKRK